MKKKIIIVALIVALISAAVGFFLVKRGSGGGAGSNFPKPVEEYTAGVEAVPSITASIEEGKEELLLSVSTSEKTEEDIKAEEEEKEKEEKEEKEKEKEKEKEEESEDDEDEVDKKEEKKRKKEEKKREKAEKKAQKKREKEEKKRNKEKEEGKDADKEKAEQSDTADASQVTGEEASEAWNKYYYQSNAHTIRVLEAYAAYLEEEGFEQVQGKGQENPELQQKEEGEKKTFYAKYQRECEEEGYLFSIELEYPLANDPAIQMYAIKAIREKAPIEQGVDGEAMTRERALVYLEGLDSTSLGLTKPLSEYYVVMDMGRSYVEGKDCYGINVYDKGTSKESYFVQKYYLSISDEELYSCDIDGVIRRLQPAKGDALAPSAEAAASQQTAGSETPTDYVAQDTNTGGIAHDWNFGPPEEKKEE